MGLTLNQYMGWRGPTTWRQHRAHVAWLDLELDQPGRTDNYIMQLTATVDRLLATHPELVEPGQYRIRFARVKPAPDPTPSADGTGVMDTDKAEELSYQNLCRWGGLLGLEVPPMPEGLKARLEASDGD